MKTALPFLPPILALMLTACGAPETDASGATPSEAQALNEAAAMLENNSISANQLLGNATEQDSE